MRPSPLTLIAELSYQCPLHCPYCSNPLDITVERCRTREQQDAAVAALRFKTEMLWAQLDAIERGDTQPPGPVA